MISRYISQYDDIPPVPGKQADHPPRGRRGWQLDARPANPSPGGQQGCGKPCQVGIGNTSKWLLLSKHCLMFRVGRDTINSSQDLKMKSEMPKSLAAIEKASDFLMEASSSLKSDPYSQVQSYQWVDGNIAGWADLGLTLSASLAVILPQAAPPLSLNCTRL